MSEGEEIWEVLEGLRHLPTDTPEQLATWLVEIGKQLSGGGNAKRFERADAQVPG